jgi:hypothetical protein
MYFRLAVFVLMVFLTPPEEAWEVKEDDTFFQAGMVGLWTKADSVTLFDTLTARSL